MILRLVIVRFELNEVMCSVADNTWSSQYSLTPSVVRTVQEDSRAVLGVAAISGHVCVVRAESPEIEIYSAVTWSLNRRLPVAGLRSPTDLVACESVGCLFVSDWSECRIHRVDFQTCRRQGLRTAISVEDSAETEDKENWLSDDRSGWWTTEKPWSLSLVQRKRQCTVLVTCDQVSLICSRARWMLLCGEAGA